MDRFLFSFVYWKPKFFSVPNCLITKRNVQHFKQHKNDKELFSSIENHSFKSLYGQISFYLRCSAKLFAVVHFFTVH